MDKVILGKTGIEVTELCFGALPIGPAQKNVPVDEAAKVMALGMELGITFFDTAQMYRTYEPLAKALRETGAKPVISSKCTAASYEDMEIAVHEALGTLDVDHIDIFFLHAARVEPTVFEDRAGAFQCLKDCKAKGLIKAVGISAHAVDVVNLAADNPGIDVVFAIINKDGMGILRGSRGDMEAAIERCFDKGKGVMLMKVLGGGNLLGRYDEAMTYARSFSKGRAAIALGMVAQNEVRTNVKYFNGVDVTAELAGVSGDAKRMMVFKSLCKACGKCGEACHSSAIGLDKGYAEINAAQCLKCGYCVTACSEFAIRMV